MTLLGELFFKKSVQELHAERQRVKAEDKLMAVHAMERQSLEYHCDFEGERALVLITRLRDSAAISKAKADRNLTATIVVGLLVLANHAPTYFDMLAKIMRLL